MLGAAILATLGVLVGLIIFYALALIVGFIILLFSE